MQLARTGRTGRSGLRACRAGLGNEAMRPILVTARSILFTSALIAFGVVTQPASAAPDQSEAAPPTVLRGASSPSFRQTPADSAGSAASEAGTLTILRGEPPPAPLPEAEAAPQPICPQAFEYVPGYGCVVPEAPGAYGYEEPSVYGYAVPVIASPVLRGRRPFAGSSRASAFPAPHRLRIRPSGQFRSKGLYGPTGLHGAKGTYGRGVPRSFPHALKPAR